MPLLLRKRFPGRVPIRINVADASTYSFPPGNLVVFLYNPFGEEVIAKVVAGIESALAVEKRCVFVIYYNPVFGACFDASCSLTRYFAAKVPMRRKNTAMGRTQMTAWLSGKAVGQNRCSPVPTRLLRLRNREYGLSLSSAAPGRLIELISEGRTRRY